VTRRQPRLADRLAGGTSVLIDTSVVLAYLAGGEPASQEAEELFDGLVATGRNPASLSAVTVAEILIRPFRTGAPAVAIAEGFLRHFADLQIVPVDYEVAREAARIRAAASLPMPDALIVASALVGEANVLITTDRSWRTKAGDLALGTEILELPG
jgi:predicted nucleic acid-binding protein